MKTDWLLRATLLVVSALLAVSPVGAHIEPVKEAEPNDTPATATPLTTTTNCFTALGAIAPAGDVDYLSFTAPPGSRVWVLVDTSASKGSRDSVVTLFGPDGKTQIAQDDNGGVGTNCDITIETRKSSALAGRTLTAGGTYFLRVQASAPTWEITLYKLFLVLTSSATAEVEPNDVAAKATPIVTAGSPVAVRQGSIRPGDTDYYSVVATTVGSALLISAAVDPRRAQEARFGLDLIQSNGFILMSADGEDGGSPTPSGISFCFIVNDRGTYFVRVRGLTSSRAVAAAPYTLLVAACGLHPEQTKAAPVASPPLAPVPPLAPTPTARPS